MAGTGTVTIGENEWSVEIANTIAELTAGLSGRASIPAGTGMLFVLPVRQVITVQTNEMLFPLDIIFIKDNLVLDIAENIDPGNLVEEATPCDGFLEINAGEAALVELGDAVDVEITTPPSGFDISSIMAFAIPLAALGLVVGILPKGSPKKELKSSGHHSIHGSEQEKPAAQTGHEITDKGVRYLKELRRLGKLTPEQEAEKATLQELFNCGELSYPFDQWEVEEKIKTPKMTYKEAKERVSKALNTLEDGGYLEHHSIHGPERDRLVGIYGSWAVGRAESVCPVDDVQCVEHEAAQFLTKFKAGRWT